MGPLNSRDGVDAYRILPEAEIDTLMESFRAQLLDVPPRAEIG